MPIARSVPRLAAVLALLLPLGACGGGGAAADRTGPVPTYGYRVVHTYPHDPQAFTEGLFYDGGALYEGTGLNGLSQLRKVALETGAVQQQVTLPSSYFGEGIAALGGKIYQLTWQTETGFRYDLATLQQTAQFSYSGEGWGLTTDGTSLIRSDGSSQIRFFDPATFKTTRTIKVTADGAAVTQLNELEYVDGLIYANVWHSNKIAQIDPQNGRVVAWIDLTGILPAAQQPSSSEAVLNGIAYDASGHRLFVTGKDWPSLFEIEVVPPAE